MEKLGFLVRFWELRARHAMLGEPLAEHEQVELLSLMQLVTAEARVPERGPIPKNRGSLPAQLIGEGAILAVDVRTVSAVALLVSAAKAHSPGSRVILRVADAISAVEYAMPCLVKWAYDGAPCVMALTVDGIPTRSDFASSPDAQTRSAMALGPHFRLVG